MLKKVYILLLYSALLCFSSIAAHLKSSVSLFLFIRLWETKYENYKSGNWTSPLFFLSLFFTHSKHWVNISFPPAYLQVCVSLCFDTCMLSRTGKKRESHWQLAWWHKTHFAGGSCLLQNVRWTLYIKVVAVLFVTHRSFECSRSCKHR